MAFTGGLLERIKTVEIQQEAVKGTFIEDSLVQMFCLDPKIESAAEYIERKGTGVAMGHTFQGIHGDEVGVFSSRVEFRGNGSNAMDVALTLILQSCGFTNASEVYSPSASVAAQKTLSIVQHDDGVKKSMAGSMGNIVISGEQGERVFAEVEMLGSYKAESDDSTPAFTPVSTVAPPLMGSGVMTYDSLSMLINSFSMDMGNVVTFRAGTTTAAQHYVITDRSPVISMDPEQDLIANIDYDNERRTRDENAFSLSIGGTATAGVTITFSAPLLQTMALPPGEREGLMMYDFTGQCNAGTGGNDEFTITVPTA